MKKILIFIFLLVDYSKIYGNNTVTDSTDITIRAITLNVCDRECKSKLPSILKCIINPKVSLYEKETFETINNGLIMTYNTFKKQMKGFDATKIHSILGFYYEKEDIEIEDYISIQEWHFCSEMDASDFMQHLKRQIEYGFEVVFMPHWIWLRSNDSVYFIKTTESTNHPLVQEAMHCLKMNIRIEDKVILN